MPVCVQINTVTHAPAGRVNQSTARLINTRPPFVCWPTIRFSWKSSWKNSECFGYGLMCESEAGSCPRSTGLRGWCPPTCPSSTAVRPPAGPISPWPSHLDAGGRSAYLPSREGQVQKGGSERTQTPWPRVARPYRHGHRLTWHFRLRECILREAARGPGGVTSNSKTSEGTVGDTPVTGALTHPWEGLLHGFWGSRPPLPPLPAITGHAHWVSRPQPGPVTMLVKFFF